MPRATAFTTEVEIDAPPDVAWGRLVQPAGVRRWLNGADVRSPWARGDDIAIDVVLEGLVRHDRGTVLEAEPSRLLRYSHWSSISRRPDTPANRSIVSFELAPLDDGRRTRLTVALEALTAGAAEPHARFFWPVALRVLRDETEGRSSGPSLVDPARTDEQSGA